MSAVSREEIERIARLAAVDIDPRSLPQLVEEIRRILEFVSQLSSIPTAPGGAQMVGGEAAPLRSDDAREAAVLDPGANAPDYRENLFLVPRLGSIEAE